MTASPLPMPFSPTPSMARSQHATVDANGAALLEVAMEATSSVAGDCDGVPRSRSESSIRNTVTFKKRVTVWHTLHLKDYTKDEVRSTWFSKSELSRNAEKESLDTFCAILVREQRQAFNRRLRANRVSVEGPSASSRQHIASKEEMKIMMLQQNIANLLKAKQQQQSQRSSRKSTNGMHRVHSDGNMVYHSSKVNDKNATSTSTNKRQLNGRKEPQKRAHSANEIPVRTPSPILKEDSVVQSSTNGRRSPPLQQHRFGGLGKKQLSDNNFMSPKNSNKRTTQEPRKEREQKPQTPQTQPKERQQRSPFESDRSSTKSSTNSSSPSSKTSQPMSSFEANMVNLQADIKRSMQQMKRISASKPTGSTMMRNSSSSYNGSWHSTFGNGNNRNNNRRSSVTSNRSSISSGSSQGSSDEFALTFSPEPVPNSKPKVSAKLKSSVSSSSSSKQRDNLGMMLMSPRTGAIPEPDSNHSTKRVSSPASVSETEELASDDPRTPGFWESLSAFE